MPRRSPEDGAGGVTSGAAPDRSPTNLGIIRGGSRTSTSAAAPHAQEPVPVLPTDRAGIGVARRGRPAVGAPSEPEVRAGPPQDEDAMIRPVLLKRPERRAVMVSPGGAASERERSSPPQASPLRGRAASGGAGCRQRVGERGTDEREARAPPAPRAPARRAAAGPPSGPRGCGRSAGRPRAFGSRGARAAGWAPGRPPGEWAVAG